MTSEAPPDKWVKLSAACERLGLSQDTVRTYGDRGWLTCVRTPTGLRLYSVKSIEDFLAGKKTR